MVEKELMQDFVSKMEVHFTELANQNLGLHEEILKLQNELVQHRQSFKTFIQIFENKTHFIQKDISEIRSTESDNTNFLFSKIERESRFLESRMETWAKFLSPIRQLWKKIFA